MAHDVFISYAVEDKPTADAVCATLEAQRIRCWIAPRDVMPGVSYAEALIDAIGESRLMVLVFSSRSNSSPQVMREVERTASKGIPILPFRIEDVPLSKSMEFFLSAPHWLDALTPPLEKHLQHLAETVKLLLSRAGGLEGLGAKEEAAEQLAGQRAAMEQEIRFCTTSDGVRIAYAIVGQGPPLVRVIGYFTHLEIEWEDPNWRDFIESLSGQLLLIRYDGRGMGLSDREVSDFSPEVHLRDLEAVVDSSGFERVALLGLSMGAATGIAYSVRHPDRVSHLILYGGYARLSWLLDTEEGLQQFQAALTLIRQAWGSDVPATRQLLTSLFMPDADLDATRGFNEFQRVSASADNAAAFLAACADVDVRELLQQVTAPTLVIHRRGDTMVPFEAGRELAAGIRGARFLPLDGRNHYFLASESVTKTIYRAVEEFICGSDD